MAEKRFYWIKLKYEFFFEDGVVDYIMNKLPKDGARYILLYQMLCLRTMNTAGELCSRIGEMLLPFDVDKIVKDCRYFKESEVVLSLELFKALGLIYENQNGILCIAKIDEMVGSEGASAARMRLSREKKRQQDEDGKRIGAPSQCDAQCDAQCAHTSVTLPSHQASHCRENTPLIPPKRKELDIEIEMTDRLTDNAGDDLKERAKKDTAGACVYASNHKRIDAANLDAYEKYIDQLYWCREDGPTGGMSVDTHDQMLRIMDTIGHEVARRATFRIHDEDIAASEVLDTLTEGMASGNAKATIAALQQVTDKQADGGIGNQLAYLVATLYTRIKQGMVA